MIMFWSDIVNQDQYKDSHSSMDFYYKDKTVVRQSYLYDGNTYTDKTTSLYWDFPQVPSIHTVPVLQIYKLALIP